MNIYHLGISKKKRKHLPLKGIGNYKLVDNKLSTITLQVNVANHCNLSCRSCSHAAPTTKKSLLDVEVLDRDLKQLSQYFWCENVRVLGGEPLLNPNLHDLIKVIRESNISNRIVLMTNGILLPKLREETILLLDEIYISFYDCKQTKNVKGYAKNISEKYKHIKVVINPKLTFRESIALVPTTDKKLIKTVYNTCKVAHVYRCITVDNGYLYRCPQQMVYAKQTGDYKESLSIENIKNVEEILCFLENNNPLSACSCCLGTIGTSFSHAQVDKNEFLQLLKQKPDDAIDWEYAKEIESEFKRKNWQTMRQIKYKVILINQVKDVLRPIYRKIKLLSASN